MKKFLLSITAAVFITLSVNAQNFGFETWITSGTVEDPTGWASFNVLTPLMQQTVFKETTAPYKGSAAAKIVTQPIPAIIPVPGYDTVGILAIGKVDAKKINFGAPFTSRPATFSFATKYIPVSLDTASVNIQITRYNPTTKLRDLIAHGQWITSTNSTAWTSQTVTLTYDNNLSKVAADTLSIIISSSSLFRPKINSTLYIDDITYAGWVSTNDLGEIQNNVTVYPSPAKENISFNSSLAANAVEILDITGRSVGVFPMAGNKVTVETAKYQSGMYIYNVLNEQNKVVGRGKFEVVK